MLHLEMNVIFPNIHRFRKHILSSHDFSPPSIKTEFISTSKVIIYEYQRSNFIHLYFLCILKAMTLYGFLYSPTFSYNFPSHIQKHKEKGDFGEACFLLTPTNIQVGSFQDRDKEVGLCHRDKRWWSKLIFSTPRPQNLPLHSRWKNHWNLHDSKKALISNRKLHYINIRFLDRQFTKIFLPFYIL